MEVTMGNDKERGKANERGEERGEETREVIRKGRRLGEVGREKEARGVTREFEETRVVTRGEGRRPGEC